MADELPIIRRVTFKADFDVTLNGVPFDATGKIVTFRLSVLKHNKFTDIFSVILDAPPNAFSSSFQSNGTTTWSLKIADEDTALIRQDNTVGTWWVTTSENGDVKEILSGVFTVKNP